MSAADAPGKYFTIGAGGPRTPSTRPAGCLHTRSCLLTPRQQHQLLNLYASEEYVALEVTWSVYQNITWRLPRARHGRGQGPDASQNQHKDLHARTELPGQTHDARHDTQTLLPGHTGLLQTPPHHRRSHRSHQRTPRTPTRLRPRTSETSPTTPPKHSSKPEESNPNYTPKCEEPGKGALRSSIRRMQNRKSHTDSGNLQLRVN